MAGFSVKLRGLFETEETLERYYTETRFLAARVLTSSAARGKKKALRRAPKGKTGNLRRSIFIRFGSSRRSNESEGSSERGRLRLRKGSFGKGSLFGYSLGADVVDDKGRQYAFWTEVGRGSKPWLRPIFKTETRYVRRLLRRGVRGIIQKLGRSIGTGRRRSRR
jgi:hypothetical protein